MRPYLSWVQRNGFLREFDIVAARGLSVDVAFGAGLLRAYVGKEPLPGTPPMKMRGSLQFVVQDCPAVMKFARLARSQGGPFYLRQEPDGFDVAFKGKVLEIFSSHAHPIVRSGEQEGYVSSTVSFDVGEAKVQLGLAHPGFDSIQVGDVFEGVSYPMFTPEEYLLYEDDQE